MLYFLSTTYQQLCLGPCLTANTVPIAFWHISYHPYIYLRHGEGYVFIVVRCFVTCQNLHFGKYVGLTVCLSVCLSVCPSLYKITDNSRTLWDIFTKISPQMNLGCSSIAISFQGQRSRPRGHRNVNIRNRRNSVNFLATAKFKNTM